MVVVFVNGRKQANVIGDWWSPAVPCIECNWTHVDLLSIRIKSTPKSKAQSQRELSTVGHRGSDKTVLTSTQELWPNVI